MSEVGFYKAGFANFRGEELKWGEAIVKAMLHNVDTDIDN